MEQNSPEKPMDMRQLRHNIGRRLTSTKQYIMKKFKEETQMYHKVFRNEFKDMLPDRLLKMDDIDVNIMFPIIKTLIPSLYYKDPKVFVKAEQEQIVIEHNDPTTGQPLINEMGQPMQDTYDGVASALKLQTKLNHEIKESRLKNEMKAVIQDAHIGYYGALKCGIGNDQGVASMGEGAPPSTRLEGEDGSLYGIRLRPWEVLVDMNDFYHPEWVAIRYEVHPDQLKADTRLKNTENLKGVAKINDDLRKELWSQMEAVEWKRTEYFEYYHKPCATYPEGIYAIVTPEVADDFLYFGPWPYKTKTFPVKILYFNPDPEGRLPIPDARYYIQQQKAKSNLRRVAYEYIQRTLPIIAIDSTKLTEQSRQQITNGQIPRIVTVSGNPGAAITAQAFANLNSDFYNLDSIIDNDVSRMMGMLKGIDVTGKSIEYSSVAKETAATEQVRTSERGDIVRDFTTEVYRFWAHLLQEFGPDEMYVPADGEQAPVTLSVDEIQGKFSFELKPFSMNYEDPTIVRRQWTDLLNLLASPEARAALESQGATVDLVKIINKILLTYDEPDVKHFINDMASKAENQVADALQENQMMVQAAQTGVPAQSVQVLPTDNHKAHILIHQMVGEVALEHMQQHQMAMTGQPAGTPGGGNKEGLPINGVATNQEQMRQPLDISVQNQMNRYEGNANNPTETR